MTRQTLARIAPVLFLIALALAGLSQCGMVQKVWLDREVDRLCAIDGGVHIYETVFLPKENFGPDGEVFPQYRTRLLSEGRFGSEYVIRFVDKVLVVGNPSITRQHTLIVRMSDEKVLGEAIRYGRRGGDIPGPWEPSYHICPSVPDPNLSGQVFKVQR